MQVVWPILSQPGQHQDYILNMDQTPIPFTFNKKKTLELIGKQTIHIRKSTNDTKRVTCAFTVTASGRSLTPFLIFKGSSKGRIVNKEFPNFPNDCMYACQENAWMDKEMMLLWVEQILAPYVTTAPPGIKPVLFLDSFRCHMMRPVVQACQDLGVQVEHIPGGCTFLCQPVDIGVNKPLKCKIRKLWQEWMILDGLSTGFMRPPSRKHIAQWVSTAKDLLTEGLVRNAWRHGAYTFFPPTCEENPLAALITVAVAMAAAVAVAMTM
jgi:hypothetical protein